MIYFYINLTSECSSSDIEYDFMNTPPSQKKATARRPPRKQQIQSEKRPSYDDLEV